MEYEKKASKEMQSADQDHPLKNQNKSDDLLDMDLLVKEIDSVAVDWKLLRTATECSCSLALDQLSKKVETSL